MVEEGFEESSSQAPLNKRRASCCQTYPNHSHPLADAEKDSYLVDPASSHMLVSKIKPCMSKYKLLYTVKLRMAH